MNTAYLSSIGIPLASKPSAHIILPEEALASAAPSTANGSSVPSKQKIDAAEAKPKAKSKAESKAKAAPTPADESAPASNRNFLKDIIDKDLAKGGRCNARLGRKGDVIRTRFPPEPNGYLHMGHAKSICINFGLAKEYGGRCHLRFDDTNPAKEETEYVDSIMEDVKWLGFDWGEHLYYASDYFDQLYEWAEFLIQKGDAYVDSQNAEDMKRRRGNVTKPGENSPFRDRTPEENLKLFREMRDGKYKEGEHILRTKIDMTSPNMNLRDPPIYRILHKAHHRTGDKWCIYPLYDFAHGQEDAIEGITHSICTLEFDAHRALYDWFTARLPLKEAPPKQFEFARLNLTDTVMSKRKLLKCVQEKVVDGWDDPRMPTICGMRRRGVRPEAVRNFATRIGVTTSNSLIDKGLFEETVREDLEPLVARRMAVLNPLKLVIEDYPADKVEEVEAVNHPARPEMGTRKVKFTREVYIEQDDFMEEPPESYFRLRPGGEVKLRNSYVVKCKEVVKDASGKIVEVRCTHDAATRDNLPSDRKVKGVIHWVSAKFNVCPKSVRLYDSLFRVDPAAQEEAAANGTAVDEEEEPANKDADFLRDVNANSLVQITNAKLEECLKDAQPFERFQFERSAYFVVDKYSTAKDLVFGRIVGLKESTHKPDKDERANERSRKDLQAKQAAEKEAKKKMKPQDMFKGQSDLYSKFDADGLPTHDAAGEALPKSRVKKLKQEWDKQKKLYESAQK